MRNADDGRERRKGTEGGRRSSRILVGERGGICLDLSGRGGRECAESNYYGLEIDEFDFGDLKRKPRSYLLQERDRVWRYKIGGK